MTVICKFYGIRKNGVKKIYIIYYQISVMDQLIWKILNITELKTGSFYFWVLGGTKRVMHPFVQFSLELGALVAEEVKAWPRGYKTFSMLNSTEHEIFPAHKC